MDTGHSTQPDGDGDSAEISEQHNVLELFNALDDHDGVSLGEARTGFSHPRYPPMDAVHAVNAECECPSIPGYITAEQLSAAFESATGRTAR